MILSDLSIRRPVLASMLSAALVLFGVIGYRQLSVREYPDVDPPIISVQTFLVGANPQVMESAVTDILEEELSTVPGLRTLVSSSGEQFSNITLEFTLDRDVDDAAQDVRDKVSRVRGRLPIDIEEPVIAKQEADASPFFWLALNGQNYSLLQLSDLADRLVKSQLQTVPGVGSVFIAGERRYAMRVWLSTAQLSARGLTVQNVEQAIRTRNVEVPAGRIESNRREFTVRSLGELKTPAEFGELVVASQGGQLVKLKDLGHVELGAEDERSALRFKGAPTVGLGVVRQSKANLITVADAVREALPSIAASLPPGVSLDVAYDGSTFVKRSILEAQETLVIAAILVVIIIFVFLRNVRSTIIPGLAIPVSIVSTFAVMYFLGFSINNLTLLALTLAIGIVVDDAIIVLENAFRHQEELGEDAETAAVNGTREIAFAVIATTIALVAVFTPLAFLKGNTGRLFNEFGIAVAGFVIVSGFVALTLTPMLCAKILRVPKEHGPVFRMFENAFTSLTTGYGRSLRWVLAHGFLTLVAAIASVVLAVVVFLGLKREFVPQADRGLFITFLIAPEGSTLSFTDQYQKQVEAIIGKTQDVDRYFSVVGGFTGSPSRGLVFTRLVDDGPRRKVQDVIAEVQGKFAAIPGVMVFANNPPAFGGSGQPVQFVVRHPDFAKLSLAMDTLVKRARQIPGLRNVDTDLRVNKPELTVGFDRDRAEDLGVGVGDVAGTMQTLLGGRRVSTFTQNNKLYDVMVQLDPAERATPNDVAGLYVSGRGGQLVQLSAVTTVKEGVGPQRLNHFDRVRSFTLTAGLDPGFTLGEALDSLNRVATEVLPPLASTRLAGESRELAESGAALYFAFGLALLVVFMVLASQFESMIHPLTVLVAVPLAITGALVTLYLTRSTINLYSQIGMILLIGLVTKNSILLVEYANQLLERGNTAREAILEAGRIRLRPILMTSVSTIMGAMPIAMGLGAGSSSRRPLGYAIAGGVFFSTILTLYLVPSVWLFFEGMRKHKVHPQPTAAAVPVMAGEAEVIAFAAALLLQVPIPVRIAPPDSSLPHVTLAEAIRLATGVDPAYVRAAGQVDDAEWGRRAAVLAFIIPSLAVSLDATRYSTAFFNIGIGAPTSNAVNFRANAIYELISVRKITDLGFTKAELEASQANAERQKFQTAFDTENDFLNVLVSRELTRVAHSRLERAQEQFTVARARVLSGAAVQTDSLQQVLELTQARLEVLRQDLALKVARLQLGRRIGRPVAVDAQVTDSMLPPDLGYTDEQLIQLALEEAPQYRQARALERSASYALKGQKGAYLPTFNLTGGFTEYDSRFPPSGQGVGSVSLIVTWPLWDRGQREIAVQQAKTNLNVARAVSADLENAASRDVTRAAEAYRISREAVSLTQLQLVAAQETFRVQELRYKSGANTILDLLEAQFQLTRAESEAVQSVYALYLSLAGLEAITGQEFLVERNQ